MRKARNKRGRVGVIKEFDNLSRLVIPKELRDLYNFSKEVEVVATNEGVLLRNPEYKLIKIRNCKV